MEEPDTYLDPIVGPWLQSTSLQDISAFDNIYNLSKNSFNVTYQIS